MPTSDTSEKGLESLIVHALAGGGQAKAAATPAATDSVVEALVPYGGAGYYFGRSQDYDRDYAVDMKQLLAFVEQTQPDAYQTLCLDADTPKRAQFLTRLSVEVGKRGVVDVLRHGVKHGPVHVDLFYGSPSPGNSKAAALYSQNRFSVTRQLRYSKAGTTLALDVCLFVNGLPLFTFELKNSLTKQTVADAVEQYKRDRDPKELLFQFKRCLAHFAVDDRQVKFCTRLEGEASWFLPFNKGYNDGAGNPPNPDGLMTAYLWTEVLTRDRLTDIIENYAQVVKEKNRKTGKIKEAQIFPRYHQLDAVRKLLADVLEHGPGLRYLIQHSAGSGKSNSIAWLAHQLVGLRKDGADVFDSIIVVTDRRNLDRQINATIKNFAQVSSVLGHADRSGDLKTFIQDGKKIIITTVQKFPYILDEIGNEHRHRKFALLLDEAHSSQSGSTSAKMHMALSAKGTAAEEEDTTENQINRILESRKMLTNASYFAFTATPKSKTLETFGIKYMEGGEAKHRPFHPYTMKQAIQEGFILDVLENYTPVDSYYRLQKTIEDDPEFDVKKARKKLRHYVESHKHAIQEKAEIMVEHFLEQVIAKQKIGGQARAMVVTGAIARAIEYFHALQERLIARKSPYKAVVAFTGEHEYGGRKVTEATLNGFASLLIEEKIQEDPYRILVCAEKFQTGYDEPLLHTMYVDKPLAGIKAVQTLSRLNRAHPKKRDTFVLDFMNDTDTIQKAFQDYYRTTIWSKESDPDRLHDLKAVMDGHQVYTSAQIDLLAGLYLGDADREKLDPILDACVSVYLSALDENGQIEFKGSAKAFLRNYNFLAAILPYSLPEWEKLSIFLTFLVPKLPAPKEEDLSLGILESIDMDSYRAEKRSTLALALEDTDAEIDPADIGSSGHLPEPELDRLSNIVKTFNDLFGNIPFTDQDKVLRLITEEIPAKVSTDKAYQNAMRNSDKPSARIEHDHALERALIAFIKDHTEFYKQFKDNDDFGRFVSNLSFSSTYQPPASE